MISLIIIIIIWFLFICELSGIQEKSNNIDFTAKLSQSAPASTTQRLLGNFEVNY